MHTYRCTHEPMICIQCSSPDRQTVQSLCCMASGASVVRDVKQTAVLHIGCTLQLVQWAPKSKRPHSWQPTTKEAWPPEAISTLRPDNGPRPYVHTRRLEAGSPARAKASSLFGILMMRIVALLSWFVQGSRSSKSAFKIPHLIRVSSCQSSKKYCLEGPPRQSPEEAADEDPQHRVPNVLSHRS